MNKNIQKSIEDIIVYCLVHMDICNLSKINISAVYPDLKIYHMDDIDAIINLYNTKYNKNITLDDTTRLYWSIALVYGEYNGL